MLLQTLTTHIPDSWRPFFTTELQQPYIKILSEFIETKYSTTTCYPKLTNIFNAFKHCALKDVKVVIIGQDPYHGANQANGLAFSVTTECTHPPSLKNIFKALYTDVGMPYPISGDLTPWAKQGVLLLNATLTVTEGKAGSHQKQGWETFTNNVIRYVSKEKRNVVFLLWGGFAKKKVTFIDTKAHYVLTSGHPSPLSANRGYWFGNAHFSKTNTILEQLGKTPINWRIN